jgi:hypothetical protein
MRQPLGIKLPSNHRGSSAITFKREKRIKSTYDQQIFRGIRGFKTDAGLKTGPHKKPASPK